MNVDDPVGEAFQNEIGDLFHIACQDQQVQGKGVDDLEHGAIAFFWIRMGDRGNVMHGNPRRLGLGGRATARVVGDQDCWGDVGQGAVLDVIQDGLEIRASARGHETDFEHKEKIACRLRNRELQFVEHRSSRWKRRDHPSLTD